MLPELDALRDLVARLDRAGIEYMLTGSVAMNFYAQPRMTRDVDLVVALHLGQIDALGNSLGDDYYFAAEAAIEAVYHQSMFNVIHQEALIKIDCVIRKREEFRLEEFSRRRKISVDDFDLWIVSKEDLILSKCYWVKESESERQLSDIQNLLATGYDEGYLQKWASHLQVNDILTRASP
jgi:hypothetical protein